MNKLPFSLYDFFSYLVTGLVWLLAVNFILDREWSSAEEVNWVTGPFYVLLMYIVGHTNSHFACWLIEKKIVGRLGNPAVTLLQQNKASKGSLPSFIVDTIKSKYKQATNEEGSEKTIFYYCFHYVKEQCPVTYERLQMFLNTYSFARNMSFALFFIGLSVLIKGCLQGDLEPLLIGAGSIASSYVLFLRFRLFYRLFAVDVYYSFAMH